MSPKEIEKESFRIIRQELSAMGKQVPEEILPTVIRVIHTTADFEYADTLVFSEGALQEAEKAILDGAHIVTDTNMALSGINKRAAGKYGIRLHCFMADEDVREQAAKQGTTRAAVSMERALQIDAPLIFAIGNAPTALIRLKELMDSGRLTPRLIIAVPVGFVNVMEAKEMILESTVPYIVNRGRKGGSSVAAAICNSILAKMS